VALLLLTFIVVLAGVFATGSDAGEKLQPTLAGSPSQFISTVWSKPFFGVTWTFTGEV
jgi:hypothetical protein